MDTNPRTAALEILNGYRPQRTNLSQLISASLAHDPHLNEKGFTRDLVWSAVRRLNTLDWLIDTFASGKLESRVRNILRLGIAQLLYMPDMPGYAAVNETVDLARRAGAARSAGLVNAVLREVQRRRDAFPWPQETAPRTALATSHPEWLVRRWIDRFGEKAAQEMCEADNRVPALTIRVNTLRGTREEIAAMLAGEGVASEPCRFSKDGLTLSCRPELEKLESFRKGFFTVQDEASQLVGFIVDPRAGENVLDLCSGAGIKATHLSQLSGGAARVTAVDISAEQLARARENFQRLGMTGIETVTADARTLAGIPADKILIDAPCSGLGAIRRKPDIKWNRTEKDVTSRYPALQKEILSHAAELVKPGGAIVYSTCTTEPEENEQVVARFLERHAGFRREEIRLPGEVLSQGDFRSYPHRHDMDGFYAALLKRE